MVFSGDEAWAAEHSEGWLAGKLEASPIFRFSARQFVECLLA
jgi:hypothetical protein